MPALPAVPKTVRFDLRQTVGPNTRVQDRIFLRYSGTLSSTDLATILTTMRNAWNTNMAPLLITAQALTSITGTDLSSNTSAQQVNTVASAGTSAQASPGAGVAMVIKLKTALRFRGGHPRFYLAGLGAGSVASATQWATTSLTNVQSGFAAFIAASILAPPAAVGTLTHTTVSYFSGFHNVTLPSGRVRSIPTVRVTPVTNDVIAIATNPLIASQRRRNQQSV